MILIFSLKQFTFVEFWRILQHLITSTNYVMFIICFCVFCRSEFVFDFSSCSAVAFDFIIYRFISAGKYLYTYSICKSEEGHFCTLNGGFGNL